MVLRYAFSTRVPYATEGLASQTPHAELLELANDIWAELTATPTFVVDLMGVPASSPLRERLRRLVKRRNRLLASLVAERRAQPQPTLEEPRDMLDELLAAGLPEDDILYTLVDLFVAGVNTVSTALEWTLLLTAKHPLEQARARADVLGAADGGELRYVQALTKEVLRAKPPLLLPRQAVRDSSVRGYHVARGTIVYANHWPLTHSDGHWLEPSAFRPRRWLEEEKDFGAAQGALACKFLPYSIGQRACPGARLAEAELAAATSVLLRKLTWRPAAPLDMSEDYGLTLSPAVLQRLQFSRVAKATRTPATTRTPAVRMALAHGDGPPTAGDGAKSRSTRRQRLKLEDPEALASVDERLREAGQDRRGGWRASKAKGNRRNRRYEKRLFHGMAEGWEGAEGEEE